MAELPFGTVTFMFTDLEVSTRLWDEEPDAMRGALARHDELLRGFIAEYRGHVVKGRGDGVHAVFATAGDAVVAAIETQRAITGEQWRVSEQLRVRIGLHAGVAELRDGDYFGSSVNRAARLMDVAHGGQIVCSAATADLARETLSEGVGFTDLGEHRLRDLTRPEHVFQVHTHDLPADFLPLLSVDSFPTNLPLQVNSFVGREQELERVLATLETARVVTLTGVGGVGKTRLALRAAAEVLPKFRDGAWLCELGGIRDGDGVVAAVATELGVTGRPGLSLQESLVAFLREQQVLLVLDNCEHLLDGAAALADQLDRACPGVTILATSREPLAIDGERVLGVRSLSIPDDDATVDDALRADSVRLFVERAQGFKDDFVLDDTNAASVAQICDRLDGVPLAIELAAARVTTMNPAEVARRLNRRFDLLAGGRRKAVERHQTLRAAVDWSYDMLDPREQQLLARLSVFVGGCTLDAAEAVCAGDPIETNDVYELLASLVARSLVQVDDSSADTRYRLLETIRQYGEERLVDPREVDTLRRRHAEFYERLMHGVGSDAWGPRQIELATRLARERDNVHSAMAFALDTEDVDLALRLLLAVPSGAIQLDDYVILSPEPVLALPGAESDPRFAPALVAAAFSAERRGDSPGALDLCDRAFAVHQQWPDELKAEYLHIRRIELRAGVAALVPRGHLRDSAELYLEAARAARAEGVPTARVALSILLAAGSTTWFDRPAAVALAEQGHRLAQESGMPVAIGTGHTVIALATAPDDPERARLHLTEAMGTGTDVAYDNTITLIGATFASARVGEWPTVLRFASRALHHQLRAQANPAAMLVGMLNLAARGLADQLPEPAAVLQGATTTIARRVVLASDASDAGLAPGGLVEFVTSCRQDATGILVEHLGAQRMRELRAEGARMTEDQACAYGRRHINTYLKTLGSA